MARRLTFAVDLPIEHATVRNQRRTTQHMLGAASAVNVPRYCARLDGSPTMHGVEGRCESRRDHPTAGA